MNGLLRDVRFGLRHLRKSPAFAGTALLTIALGIGAATAIFSVVNAILLRPLPYKDPDRLVLVWQELRARAVQDAPFPAADFSDLRQQGTLFDGFAALQTGRRSIATESGESEQLRVAQVTANIFAVLGGRIYRGRDFTDADGTRPSDAPPSAPSVAVFSYEFWQRHFGGNDSVLNTVVDVGGGARVLVVGVLEPGFELLFPPRVNIERTPDMYTTMRVDFAGGSRANAFLRVIGRMKPGVSAGAAQGQMDALAADLRAKFPAKAAADLRIRVNPMHEDLVSGVKPAVLSLMGAVLFVLLIACANVANLLLARASHRERELAVRSALGAGRGRLVRQMLVESLVISTSGALIGLVLAKLGLRMLIAIGPASLPRLEQIALDPFVLTFAALAAIASAALFGLLPAWRTTQQSFVGALRKSGRGAGLTGGRLRAGVAVAEVALSFVLLVGSGLMLRSFIALQRIDPGFDPKGVLTMFVPNIRAGSLEAASAFVNDLKARLMALPGVTHVSATTQMPLDGTTIFNSTWGPEAAAANPTLMQQADSVSIQPGYFEAIGTRLLAGRSFTAGDSAPNSFVIVIDALLAAKAFPGQPAVGQHIVIRTGSPTPDRYEIVGVVAHQRWAALAEDGREQMYFAAGPFNARRWIIRTTADPASLVTGAKAAVAALDRRTAVAEVQPLQDFVDRAQGSTRFAFALVGVFAAIAVALAAVGLYGVLATLVRQRTPEIGVRMTFGAGRAAIFALIVGQGLRLSLAGLAIGLLAALGLTQVLRTSRLLIGVGPTDPATFIAMAFVFLVIAGVACSLPSLRAARLDPIAALRDD